ncbi:hypothetical protein HDV05_004349 [Chytridiales sp. JEL 0842]|nr:hypothetical protein HDV05_004349 [Chytridiales sp. JEL 0842]
MPATQLTTTQTTSLLLTLTLTAALTALAAAGYTTYTLSTRSNRKDEEDDDDIFRRGGRKGLFESVVWYMHQRRRMLESQQTCFSEPIQMLSLPSETTDDDAGAKEEPHMDDSTKDSEQGPHKVDVIQATTQKAVLPVTPPTTPQDIDSSAHKDAGASLERFPFPAMQIPPADFPITVEPESSVIAPSAELLVIQPTKEIAQDETPINALLESLTPPPSLQIPYTPPRTSVASTVVTRATTFEPDWNSTPSIRILEPLPPSTLGSISEEEEEEEVSRNQDEFLGELLMSLPTDMDSNASEAGSTIMSLSESISTHSISGSFISTGKQQWGDASWISSFSTQSVPNKSVILGPLLDIPLPPEAATQPTTPNNAFNKTKVGMKEPSYTLTKYLESYNPHLTPQPSPLMHHQQVQWPIVSPYTPSSRWGSRRGSVQSVGSWESFGGSSIGGGDGGGEVE